MATPLPAASPIATAVQRTPPVTSFGLRKLVVNRLNALPATPRRPGFHPSELHRLCPVFYYFMEQARLGLASDNPRPHYEFLAEALAAKRKDFPGHLILEFEVGDAIHQMVQYHLGVNGVLWGVWMCPRCERRTKPGFMPRVTAPGMGGQPVFGPAPCVGCRGTNRRERHSWLYLEPRVYSEEWGIDGRCDGDLRVQRGDQVYRCALEIKSINDAGYSQKMGPLPKPEHVTQASSYAWIMGVDWLYFVYVNKNQVNRWKEIMVPPDQVAIAEAQRKIGAANHGAQLRRPPVEARICPDVRDQMARGCPAVEPCFGCKPPSSFWDKDADGVFE